MASLAAVVDRAIRATGVSIDGVSIGDPGDRATWRILFAAGATGAQRATASALLATVAVDAAAQAAADQQDAQAFIDTLPIWAKALALALLDEINLLRVAQALPPRTVPQALAAIRAKAGVIS